MVTKILGLLAYGRKIEKYALSAKAISRALQSLEKDLTEIWGDSSTVKKSKDKGVSKGIQKVLQNAKKEVETKEDLKDVQKG